MPHMKCLIPLTDGSVGRLLILLFTPCLHVFSNLTASKSWFLILYICQRMMFEHFIRIVLLNNIAPDSSKPPVKEFRVIWGKPRDCGLARRRHPRWCICLASVWEKTEHESNRYALSPPSRTAQTQIMGFYCYHLLIMAVDRFVVMPKAWPWEVVRLELSAVPILIRGAM